MFKILRHMQYLISDLSYTHARERTPPPPGVNVTFTWVKTNWWSFGNRVRVCSRVDAWGDTSNGSGTGTWNSVFGSIMHYKILVLKWESFARFSLFIFGQFWCFLKSRVKKNPKKSFFFQITFKKVNPFFYGVLPKLSTRPVTT